MGDNSKIQWTDATWNPVLGCERVSSGCANCYAVQTVWRMAHNSNEKIRAANEELVERRANGALDWTGEVNMISERLDIPLHWKRPRRIFVNSQSDLFHESVEDWFIDKVLGVMLLCPQHTFQVLTKRPERMYDYMRRHIWALPNVWLGVSVEDQKTAEARIPFLLETRSAIRFVSYEPALGPVDFTRLRSVDRSKNWWYDALDGRMKMKEIINFLPRLDWVIVGGESGPNARPFHTAWAEATIEACRAADVPVFVKQLGAVPVMQADQWRALDPAPLLNAANDRRVPKDCVPLMLRDNHGADGDEWPPELRVREFPMAKETILE